MIEKKKSAKTAKLIEEDDDVKNEEYEPRFGTDEQKKEFKEVHNLVEEEKKKPKRKLSEKQLEALARGRKTRHEQMRNPKKTPVKVAPKIVEEESDSDTDTDSSDEEPTPKPVRKSTRVVNKKKPKTKVVEKHYYHYKETDDEPKNKVIVEDKEIEKPKSKPPEPAKKIVENSDKPKKTLIFR